MKTLLSFYTYKLGIYFVYMLQQVEYDPKKFDDWLKYLVKNNEPINKVLYRKSLVMTRKAVLLLAMTYLSAATILPVYIALFYNNPTQIFIHLFTILVLVIILPYLLILVLFMVTYIAHKLIVLPNKQKLISQSKAIFSNHPGIKIAIIGSYGKTTMKELLKTILSESKNVKATPGNMNVAVSHAIFAKQLNCTEDVLIVEFGEGEPGDIEQMSETLEPDYAIITGLAPNHLDHYPSVDAVAQDLLSVYNHVDNAQVFVTNESKTLKSYIYEDSHTFSHTAVMGWKISHIIVSVTETKFTMKKGSKVLNITTGLLGRHQVAPVALGAALADKLGLTKKQIESGCSNINPYEHRMQPRYMHGSWLIDDTYNGNIEGLLAGLKLLQELDFKRKWYVTPGLVDQGVETNRTHVELGEAIARTKPDIVVLMDNSVRPIIEKSMRAAGFSGEIHVEVNPLEFYTNIDQVIASGDLVMMQNDWTDNYN